MYFWKAARPASLAAHAATAFHAGQQQEAEAAVRQALILVPGYTIAWRIANTPFRDNAISEVFAQGLRAAGLPDG